MNSQYSPISVFIFSFLVSGTAGIAAFLRSGNVVKVISLVTAGLNSGLLGLAISLLWYQKFADNVHFLLGICVITGLMGAAGLDFIITIITKGLISNLAKGESLNLDKDKDKTPKVEEKKDEPKT